MSRFVAVGLAFVVWACSDTAKNPGASSAKADTNVKAGLCENWPHTGLEPACDFPLGKGSDQSGPSAAKLPKPTGVCPGFADGDGCTADPSGGLVCTFQPAGEPARDVRVWLPPAPRTGPGPLVIYYYGLLGAPDNAVTPYAGFAADAQQRLFDAGGILVAPQARGDRSPVAFSHLPWIGALGFVDDDGDFLLVDEIVGCAIERADIDTRRIHVTGLSAGSFMTAQVAVHRSNYVASIAMFSGGIEDLSGLEDPTNAFPVAMFNGGTSDVVGAHFQNEAASGMNMWRSHGHFAVSCDHEGGHSVPPPAGLAGMQFMLDHPYGTLHSPYCDAPPPELSLCALTTPAPDGVPFDEGRPPADVQACVDQTKSLGLASPLLTDKLFSCSCDHCSAALEACIGDSGCLSTLQCAAQNGCMGIGCYQDTLCSSVIDAAGGIMGASSQLAVAFSDCLGASACALCEGK